ncbi:hypothetical protein DVS28_b0179 (plasmid) [Euzebya pacifica]|uniref:Uncharacterized protein n=1 Tax=Euzebya pacifica TaxID=1608957 RepID=A0A346Y652_9ACTN|nr:hypothetical protein [Euzebya pacifica]AXV09949.1 hypothetical protein DVS28_b0179 [Euzebya pacifica]
MSGDTIIGHGLGARAKDARALFERYCPNGAEDETRALYEYLCLLAAMDHRDGSDGRAESPYRLVIEYGTPFTCDNSDAGLAAAGLARGQRRECAKNAWRAMSDHRLVYVEGYGRNLIPGTWHAWNHDPVGCRSFDLTWRPDPDTTPAWIGIPFTTAAVTATSGHTGRYGLLPEVALTRDRLHDMIHPCLNDLRAANGQPPIGQTR